MEIRVKKLHADVKLPVYAHPSDAGIDLFALEDTATLPGEVSKIRTGVAMEIPSGYVGLVWDKSGISTGKSLKTLGGVIDSGYRGEVLVGLVNLGKEPHLFKKGDKVAQMLIQKVECPQIVETHELSETSRGEGGFGSTGR